MTTRNPLPALAAALFLLFLVGVLLMATAAAAAAATPPAAAANPTVRLRRFVLLAGVDDGGPTRTKLRYAASDAHAMGRVLQTLGGVAPEDMVFVSTANRAAFDAAFADIEQRLRAGTQAGVRRELLVYYSGHSDEDGLLVGRDRVGYDELRARVQRAPADLRVVILDSCASGAFTRRKGGVKRAPFLMDASIGHARARVPDLQRRRRARAGIGSHLRLVLHLLPGVGAARRRRRQPGPARHAAGGVSVRVAGDAGAHRAFAGRPAARRLRVRPGGHGRHGRDRRARHAVGPGADARARRPHHRARGERRAGRRAAQARGQHHRAGPRSGRLRRRDGQRQHDLPGERVAHRRQAHAARRRRVPRRRAPARRPSRAATTRPPQPGEPAATATAAATPPPVVGTDGVQAVVLSRPRATRAPTCTASRSASWPIGPSACTASSWPSPGRRPTSISWRCSSPRAPTWRAAASRARRSRRAPTS